MVSIAKIVIGCFGYFYVVDLKKMSREGDFFTDEYFMRSALREAAIAAQEDEVPIGAVIVCNNIIIAKGHNMTERLNDVTAHAEMLAFTAAAAYLNSKYLRECTLYITLEPCLMCAGAAYWSQIQRIVFGAADEKRGYSRVGFPLLHPTTILKRGVLADESAEMLKAYFRSKRIG